MQNKIKILVIAGPTTSGKSDLAVKIAKEKNGEIISADSRQVYKGLDIGSGKITQEEMQNITHYGIDIINPMQNFSVYDFVNYAEQKIKEINQKNKLPIICGGTGYYIYHLIYGLPDNPPINTKLRNELNKISINELLDKLKQKDKDYYEKIDKNNKRRIIRALEILEKKEKIEELNKEPKYNVKYIILNPTKEELKEKIKIRLEKRLENDAMINEVRDLIKEGVLEDWLISLGLEYKYITLYLQNKLTYSEMKENLLSKIYQYAKRQITWNKKYLK